MRRGVSLVEILVGAAILAAVLVPLYDFLGGSRATLGASKEMLLIETRSLQALAEAATLVGSGGLAGLGAEQEEVLEAEEEGFRCEVRIRRVAGRPLYRLTVRGTGSDRFFEVATLVSDPLASLGGPAVAVPPAPVEEPPQ